MRVDLNTIEKLQLELTMEDILNAIARAPKLKISKQDIRINKNRIRIFVRDFTEKERRATKTESDVFSRVQALKRALPSIVVKGYPQAARAVVKKDEKTGKNELLVEGYGLKLCMNTEGIIGTQSKSNSIMEMREALGIEAARFASPQKNPFWC